MLKEPEKYLKPLRASVKRKNHAVFDIESNEWTNYEMGGFYDGLNYIFCPTLDDLLSAILKKKNRSKIIFAHNGGRFDFQFILEHLRKTRNVTIKLIVQGPRITALKIKHGKQWITLQDSYPLLTYSLKALSEAFPVKHKKLDHDHSIRIDKNNIDHQQYLKNDCLCLYEIIDHYKKLPFIKDIGIKLTRSSAGLAAWRTTLNGPIRTTSNYVQNFVRRGYAGGRCEIFRQISGGNYRYDVNSLYPSMLLQPLPTEYISESSDPEEFGFHDCTFMVPETYLPILWKKTPKLIFPTGKFRGVFFSEEIKLAVQNGAKILKHHEGHAFTKTEHLFTDFINKAYTIRKENPGLNPLNILAKDLMNHTYGKFAEREEKKTLIKADQTNPDLWPPEFSFFHSEKMFKDTGLIEIKKWQRNTHMLCHISAAVTAWGRIHMAEKIYLPYQDSIAYTDTDSGDIKGNIPDSLELGELKREYSIKKGFYLLPKAYWLELENGKIVKKIKGFSRKTLESITYEMFIKGDVKEAERKFATFKSALIRKNTYLTLLDFKKSIISEYSKRKLLPGGETRPWHINNKGKII